ncbi:hypothetical protein [Cellulomonas sp. NPDC089187]|uniref:hypothetical protein n=1 Tax=Cellulomonas sp. NPDC089187 TaxID=3154970 RepID=UPI00342E3497
MSHRDDLSADARAVLQCGLEDWVSLGELHAIVTFHGAAVPLNAIRSLVTELTDRELVRIGGLTATGFEPFDGDVAGARSVLLSEYVAAAPTWPFNVWLDNTAAGDELARSLPVDGYLTRP